MATATEYLASLKALIPQGKAWAAEAGSNISNLLQAVADELARIDSRARALIREADPRTSNELLADWERVVTSVDGCGSSGTALQDRRYAVAMKLAQTGGQSIDYFIGVAASLGYVVTIDELGDFEWRINAPDSSMTLFSVGESAVGEALAEWGDEYFECVLNHIKPAHTNLLFGYS